MAHIEPRKNKEGKITSYRIVVSAGLDISGKQIKRQTTWKPKGKMTARQIEKELNIFAADFENKVRNGIILDGKNITVQQFYYKWLKEYVDVNLAATTQQWYRDMFEKRILPAIGHLKIGEVKPLHLQTFLNTLTKEGATVDSKPFSPISVKRYKAALSSLFGKAEQWEIITGNPAKKPKHPKRKPFATASNVSPPNKL